MTRRELMKQMLGLAVTAWGAAGCGALGAPRETADLLTETGGAGASGPVAHLDGRIDEILGVLRGEVNGQRAWDDAAAIQALDRYFTFSHFRRSAEVSAGKLREAGLREVEVLQAPADGRSVFGDWKMPLAWDVEGATFDLIGSDGKSERIADRARVPCSLAMWSAPTPPQGTEAEILSIDRSWGSGGPGARLRGKIAFTSANPAWVKRWLLDQGAVGILSDSQEHGVDLPDAVGWSNAWSDAPGGWAFTADDTPAWAFVISPREGEKLRRRLQGGERLRGRAVVKSRLYEGTLPAVTGYIPGTGEEEVLLVTHQFEQGAVDCAGSVGIIMEALRSLQSLVSEGKLPSPKRSIRCLFVSEIYTLLYWLEQKRRAPHTVAGVCIDNPCEVLKLAVRPLEISMNPHSQMSYVDALLLRLAGQVMFRAPEYPWKEIPFGTTDNVIADKTIDVPCTWIGSCNRTHHTSADTMEVLDSKSQELVAQMAAGYVYLIATAGIDEAPELAEMAAARGKAALAAAREVEQGRVAEAGLDDCMLQLYYLADRHAEAVESVVRLVPPAAQGALRPRLSALKKEVLQAGRAEAAELARAAGQEGHQPEPWKPTGELASIHPRRLVMGPLALERLSEEEREGRPRPRWSGSLFAVLNWCDGQRSLAEACHLAARELRGRQRPHGPRERPEPIRTKTPDELMEHISWREESMLEYFKFLRRRGYVAW